MRIHAPNLRAVSRTGLILLAAFTLAACTSSHEKTAASSAPASRTFSLNADHRGDATSGVTLIHVRPDGAVVIRTGADSGLFTATPGGYFDSERFGRHGLQLVASSPATRSATFQQAAGSER